MGALQIKPSSVFVLTGTIAADSTAGNVRRWAGTASTSAYFHQAEMA